MEISEAYRLVRGRIPEAVRHSDHICSEVVRHDFGHCPKPSGSQYAWRRYQEAGRAGRYSEDQGGAARHRLVNLVLTGEDEGLIDRVLFVRLAQVLGERRTRAR